MDTNMVNADTLERVLLDQIGRHATEEVFALLDADEQVSWGSRVTVRIDNTYSDGHESTREVELPRPAGDLEAWWESVVWKETGDGHGVDRIGSCYTATIVESDDPALVGESYEWVS